MSTEKKFNFAEGEVILIDKPLEWTSFDVVKKVRGTIRVKKVGHAGTLDPLATGLLILCSGKKTKQIQYIQADEKEYVAELVLGKTTPSFDLETEIEEVADPSHLTASQIKEAILSFQGEIDQVPPAFSAVQVNGVRAYKQARAGKEVKLEPRKVTISQIDEIEITGDKVSFRVICSKGTYIRSLVRDIGDKLEVGAYMSGLVRTRIGEYLLKDAYQLEDFVTLVKKQKEESTES